MVEDTSIEPAALILTLGREGVLTAPDVVRFVKHGGPSMRTEYMPNGTGRPGTDYQALCDQLLEPFNVRRAILSFNTGLEAGVRDPWQAVEICRAINDWNRDRWLGIDDDRLRSAVLVQTHLPELAALEIQRVGRHPKIAEVRFMTSALGKPFGHPVYDPIYKAAAELGLPMASTSEGNIRTSLVISRLAAYRVRTLRCIAWFTSRYSTMF